MPKPISWLLPGLTIAVAAGGYIQVASAPVFWCGRSEAFPGTPVLTALCLGQAALCLAAASSPRWERPYRCSQYAALPFVLFGLWQVFAPHPRTVLFLAALAAVPVGLAQRRHWMRPHLPALAGLFLLSALGLLAAIGQVPFTLPGVTVPTWYIGLAAVAAAACSVPAIGSVAGVAPTGGDLSCRPPSSDRAWYLPLSLLLLPVLRAKLPDIAYDSFSYKATIPYQMAEWRTGDTALIDGYMVGTNLQEMLNTQLLVLAPDYVPSLVSTISFILLWLVVPLAFPGSRIVAAFAGLSAFVLTEAGIAQGTAYHEPLLLLFMVASLIRCPAWPAFLALAVAVKINAAFIAPLVVLHHSLRDPGFWHSPRRVMIGALAGALVLAPQLGRNVTYAGRLLGMSEALATVTDPPGPHRVMAAGATRYDARPRGGIVNNAVQSACNMWLLDGLCSVKYDGTTEAGFNVFPASRAPLFALLFGAAALAGRRDRLAAFASAAVFAACCAGLLAFLSEDRYFLPLSFGFSVLLLINGRAAAAIARSFAPRPWAGAAFGCFLIGADLVPGAFTNASWICKRDVLPPAQAVDWRRLQTPAQEFLASYVTRYKQMCPPPGLPPVILAQSDRLNSPYLGTQRIFYVFTQAMIARFFAADPSRQARAAQAVIAVAYDDPSYPGAMFGAAATDFVACFDGVACSTKLAPAGTECARSLYKP